MSYIVVVLGYSDSGKDKFAEYFNLFSGSSNIKFSKPMKDMLSLVYDLPDGALEDKVFRSTLVPEHPDLITWSELMLRCFEYFPKLDPYMMIRKVKKQIEHLLACKVPVVLTDLRNASEVYYVTQLCRSYPLYTVALSREQAVPKVSDKELQRNLSELTIYSQSSYHLDNNGSLNDLREAACKLYYRINKWQPHK